MLSARFIPFLFVAVVCNVTPSANAAPVDQVSCLYDTVDRAKLVEFGKSAIGEEAETGLDPLLNTAQNACIDQYGWTENDAGNAETYFMYRVARERLAMLIREAGADTRQLDRAYVALVERKKRGDSDSEEASLDVFLQSFGFPTDNQQLLKAAAGYLAMGQREQAAQLAFSNGTTPVR